MHRLWAFLNGFAGGLAFCLFAVMTVEIVLTFGLW